MRKSTIIGAVLVGGIALAGCTPAEFDSDQPPAPGTPPADAPKMAGEAASGGEHGASGAAAELLNNRQQVLALAQLGATKATSPQAKDIAAELQQKATEQVSQLQQHGGGESHAAAADPGLSALSGPAFDAQWKQKMLTLVNQAATLAQSAQQDAELKELATELSSEQQEITAKLAAIA